MWPAWVPAGPARNHRGAGFVAIPSSSGRCRGFVGVRQKGMGIDVTTNTVEGMFGIFKRGMAGIYQHCGEQYLPRYLDEFTFRWNNLSKLGVEDHEACSHRGLRHE